MPVYLAKYFDAKGLHAAPSVDAKRFSSLKYILTFGVGVQ